MRPLAVLLLLGLALASVPPVSAAPTGQGITVAVLDSGVDDSHPELSGRVERMSFQPALPGLPVGPDTAVADPSGQGTAVASLVAGATLGVAPQASILSLQVSARYTGTAVDPVAEQAAIDAMDYLLDNPGRAQVVLLSFASRGLSGSGAETLAQQADGLRDAGVLVIVPLASPLSSLHSDPGVLTVGGDNCGTPATSDGDTPQKPDLVAPSTNLRAAQATTATTPGGGTTTVSGTAYAAAQVAGVAALMLEVRDDLPVDATAAILRDSAAHGSARVDPCRGFGLLTRDAAVAAAEAWIDPLTVYPTKPTPGLGAAALVLLLALVAAARRGHA